MLNYWSIILSNEYKWLNLEKARFYKITINKYGNNNIVLDYRWGSCITNRGGKKSLCVPSEKEAQSYIDKMIKRRKSRGYQLISV